MHCSQCGVPLADNSRFCNNCGAAVELIEQPSAVDSRGAPPVPKLVAQGATEPSMAVRIAQGKVASGKRLKAEDQLALMTYEKSQGRKVSGAAMTAATAMVVYKMGCALVFLIIMGVVLYACFTAH